LPCLWLQKLLLIWRFISLTLYDALFTRNGHDWTDRYPLIVEAALKNRSSSFVIDGEAVVLGVDGVSDFDGRRSGKHDAEVQFYAFECLRSTVMICASCH
jgi:hypothetical protein